MKNYVLLITGILIGLFSHSQPILLDDTKWYRKGPNCAYVISLGMAPSNPDVIYIGTYSGGVYKTIDGGETWIYCSTEILPQYEDSLNYSPTLPCWYFGDYYPVYTVAVHPQDENHLWIGTQERGLFESTNGGSTWQKANETLPDTLAVNLIKINQQNPDDIVLGTGKYFTVGSPQNGGLYRTLDGGDTWSLDEGLPNGNTYQIRDIKRDPSDFEHIIVGISSAGEPGFSWGIKESYDNGNTWLTVTDIFPFSEICIDPQNSQFWWGVGYTTYGDWWLFTSDDGGQNWSLYEGFEDPYKWVMSMYADADFNLYIERDSDDYSILKSPDNGISWFEVDKLSNKVSCLYGTIRLKNRCEAEVSNTDNVYFGTYWGVFHSEDGGITTQIQNTNLMNSYILDIEIHPKNSDIIYAAGNQGLWKSINGGLNWEYISQDNLTVVKCDPKHPDTIYFGGRRSLWRSFDGGQTYQKIADTIGIISDIAINPKETNILYYKRGGVGKSIDYGDTWEVIYSGPSYREIVLDPNHPDTLYLGGHRSTDGGVTWENFCDKLIMAVHPQNANIIYATNATYLGNTTVEVSYDWGESFQILAEYQNGPLPNYNIYCFRIYKENPDYLFYSTRNNKIFYSSDAGSNWQQLDGKYNTRVTDIIPFVNENKYYLATHGDGVWIYDTMYTTPIFDNFTVKENYLIKVAPNPFNSITQIWYKLENNSIVKLKIYNNSGQLVSTLNEGTKLKGTHQVVFDASDLKNGIYFCSININGKTTDSKKMTITK